MPNNDYVKREDIFPAMTEIAKEIVFGNQDDDKVVDIINSIPAADVDLVRHGRWIDENPASPIDPRMRCSICGHVDLPLAKWRFCPMCSAKMDKEADDV